MKWNRNIFLLINLLAFSILFTQKVGAETCSNAPVQTLSENITFDSFTEPLEFQIYLPACYDPKITPGYPVVYLLHGQGMDEKIWDQTNLPEVLQKGQADLSLRQFMVVMPKEKDFLQVMAYSNFGNMVMNGLIPWIDSHFNTIKDRKYRAIGGISRGALWASELAFNHPETFSSAGLHSLPGSDFSDQALQVLLPNMRGDHAIRIYMDSGSDDPFIAEAKKLSDQLNSLRYPFMRIINPGGHDSAYWSSQIAAYLQFYSDGFLN